jgi:SAM-dependent methyltransferase
MKPHSPACDRNRDPILAVLLRRFSAVRSVLEIGSGTGQHAVYFAQAMPALIWQCSDRSSYLPGIRQWLDEAQLPNTPQPLQLDVAAGPWPSERFDAVFSANTLHIMSWEEVEDFFCGLDAVLAIGATLVIYGPFNYDGTFTSDSNREFDASLRTRDPRMGIRDFEAVDGLAGNIGLQLIEDAAMPANNRCLVWRRR